MRQNGKNGRVSCFDQWTLKQDFSRFKPRKEIKLDKGGKKKLHFKKVVSIIKTGPPHVHRHIEQ